MADPLDGWQWRNPLPLGHSLAGVTYGNGAFVAVGAFAPILISHDGQTWAAASTNFGTYDLRGVTVGDGVFVAVGSAVAVLPAGQLLFGPILSSRTA